MTTQAECLLLLTTLPDPDSAERLARQLVTAGLAACVNVLAPCRSIYRWQGQLETASEVPLLIKTTADNYPALQATLVSSHPYELPELIAVPITRGLPAYLDWLAQATSAIS